MCNLPANRRLRAPFRSQLDSIVKVALRQQASLETQEQLIGAYEVRPLGAAFSGSHTVSATPAFFLKHAASRGSSRSDTVPGTDVERALGVLQATINAAGRRQLTVSVVPKYGDAIMDAENDGFPGLIASEISGDTEAAALVEQFTMTVRSCVCQPVRRQLSPVRANVVHVLCRRGCSWTCRSRPSRSTESRRAGGE